jgi:hypothetical protein
MRSTLRHLAESLLGVVVPDAEPGLPGLSFDSLPAGCVHYLHVHYVQLIPHSFCNRVGVEHVEEARDETVVKVDGCDLMFLGEGAADDFAS